MGFKKKRIVKEGVTSSDLCLHGLNYLIDNNLITKDEIDFAQAVIIDGGHSYEACLSDIKLCLSYCSSNTIIVIDDFDADSIQKAYKGNNGGSGGGGASTFTVGAAVKKMTKDKRLYRRLDYDLACPEHL